MILQLSKIPIREKKNHKELIIRIYVRSKHRYYIRTCRNVILF